MVCLPLTGALSFWSYTVTTLTTYSVTGSRSDRDRNTMLYPVLSNPRRSAHVCPSHLLDRSKVLVAPPTFTSWTSRSL